MWRSTGWPPKNSRRRQRRNLLQRLQRPDIPDLPKLVVDDLDRANKLDPQQFGAYAIHRQMTLAQLDELLKLKAATS